jgi:hypothetical protein
VSATASIGRDGPEIRIDPERRTEATGSEGGMHSAPVGSASEGAVPLLNTTLDRAPVDREMRAIGVCFVDDFLADDALRALVAFCEENPGLYSRRYPRYWSADWYWEGRENFWSPMLEALSKEIRLAFAFLEGTELVNLWSFRYDGTGGVGLHCDHTAEHCFTVNLWIGSDSDDLDPANSGLMVWPKAFDPRIKEPAIFNTDNGLTRRHIEGVDAVVVPHRRNRMVVFRANYVHTSQAFSFVPGKRVSVTWVYGR